LAEASGLLSNQYVIDIRLRRNDVPDFSAYPFNLDAVRSLDTIRLHPKVTFFVGENGSGKSTLLEAIAVNWGFNAEGGTRNFSFGTRRSHSELHKYLRLSRGVKRPKDGFFLRAESFFNVATEIENLDNEFSYSPPIIDSYGGESLHEQSHGESFLALFMNRFSGRSLFILDEPEAALSPTRQLAMLSRMHQLVEDDCQFIVATHSPIVMAYPDAKIFSLGQGGLQEVDYEHTEHYQVTRRFMNGRDSMLRELFGE
jgi:predicted ATPase